MTIISQRIHRESIKSELNVISWDNRLLATCQCDCVGLPLKRRKNFFVLIPDAQRLSLGTLDDPGHHKWYVYSVFIFIFIGPKIDIWQLTSAVVVDSHHCTEEKTSSIWFLMHSVCLQARLIDDSGFTLHRRRNFSELIPDARRLS